MNENETTETKKMSRHQMLKIKVQSKLMRVLTVSMIFGTMAVGNAAAINNSSFQGITDVIEAIIPLFNSIIDLVVAIVPLTITMALIGGLVLLIQRALKGAFK